MHPRRLSCADVAGGCRHQRCTRRGGAGCQRVARPVRGPEGRDRVMRRDLLAAARRSPAVAVSPDRTTVYVTGAAAAAAATGRSPAAPLPGASWASRYHVPRTSARCLLRGREPCRDRGVRDGGQLQPDRLRLRHRRPPRLRPRRCLSWRAAAETPRPEFALQRQQLRDQQRVIADQNRSRSASKPTRVDSSARQIDGEQGHMLPHTRSEPVHLVVITKRSQAAHPPGCLHGHGDR